MAAVDYFLKIDGISGESTDAKHKGEIEVESFSWGVSNSASPLGAGGGGGAGRARFSAFTFEAPVSSASPALFIKCASGQHIKQAVLSARTVSDEPVEFLKITLSDVLVSSYESSTPTPSPNPIDAVSVGVIAPGGPDDAVSLDYRSLQFAEGPQQHISVGPTATGILRYDPKTQQVTFVEGPADVLAVGSVDGGVQRGVQEFDISDLLGLLTAPFSTAHLRLTVSEVRQAVDATGTTVASVDPHGATPRGPQPHVFEVILYTPADGAIEPADLYRPGRQKPGRITVDPGGAPASLEMDLTEIVTRHDLAAFGIRIQLQGLAVPKLDAPDDTADADSVGVDGAKPGQPFSAAFALDLALDTA